MRKRTTANLGLTVAAALVKYLRSEEGQRQLRRAPELIRWARQQRGEREKYPGAIEVPGHDTEHREAGELADPPRIAMPQIGKRATATNDDVSWKRRYNPVEYFGQRGLDRRIVRLRRGLALAFGEQAVSERPEIFEALAELERASRVAAALPLAKRQRLHLRIGRQLDKLEVALADAALPS